MEENMIDKKAIISDIAGLSQPLTKLVEAITAGIGTWYEPIGIERKAKAEAKQIQIIAEMCTKNINVPVHYNKDGTDIDTNKPVLELAKRAMLRNFAQEMNKQQNIESVINYAKEILEKEQEVSKDPVSQTWLSNFFESAGHVEEEDLQKIWGRLLAGEIKQPNSYSLRTMNLLRNMTTREARIFQAISPFVVVANNQYVVPSDKELYTKYKIKYAQILQLDECGLINAQGLLSLTFSSGSGGEVHIYNYDLFARLLEKAGINMHLQINIYPLTVAGKELFNVIARDSNQDFFKDYIKRIEQRNKNMAAYIYKKELLPGKDGNFNIQDQIYPEK